MYSKHLMNKRLALVIPLNALLFYGARRKTCVWLQLSMSMITRMSSEGVLHRPLGFHPCSVIKRCICVLPTMFIDRTIIVMVNTRFLFFVSVTSLGIFLELVLTVLMILLLDCRVLWICHHHKSKTNCHSDKTLCVIHSFHILCLYCLDP